VSIYIHKSHNISVLIYHLVCVGKGRETWFREARVDEEMKNTCLEIARRYDVNFLEIGSDQDHVHFLIQSVPMYSPTKIARMVKSITAREILKKFPDLKNKLWNGEFWSNGYFINTVGRSGSETVIQKYVKSQGHQNYKLLHKDQLKLFPSS
jgi:putative transposase